MSSTMITTERNVDSLDFIQDDKQWVLAQEKKAVQYEQDDFKNHLTIKSWAYHKDDCQCLKCLTELMRSAFNMHQNGRRYGGGQYSGYKLAKASRIAAWGVGEETATKKCSRLFGCKTSEITGHVHDLYKFGSKAAIWGEVRKQFDCDRETVDGRIVSVRTVLYCTANKAYHRISDWPLDVEKLNSAFYRLLCDFVRGSIAEMKTIKMLKKLIADGELDGYKAIRAADDDEEPLDIDVWLQDDDSNWVAVSIKSGYTMTLHGLNQYRLHGRTKLTRPELYIGFDAREEEEWTQDNLKFYTAEQVEAVE